MNAYVSRCVDGESRASEIYSFALNDLCGSFQHLTARMKLVGEMVPRLYDSTRGGKMHEMSLLSVFVSQHGVVLLAYVAESAYPAPSYVNVTANKK